MILEIAGYAIIPAIIGIVSVCKGIGLPSRWAPVVSIILGITFATFAMGIGLNTLYVGIVIGLMASGLWDVGKKTIGGN